MIDERLRKAIVCAVVAFGVGLLELAWGADSRGPERVVWGISAIFIIFFAVSWPKIWWIPALAIVEEWGTVFFWPTTWNPLFAHWSTQLLGFNVYPWFLFPALSISGEFVFRLMYRSSRTIAIVDPSSDGGNAKRVNGDG